MSAIPASSITTRLSGPIVAAQPGRSSWAIDQASFASVSVGASICSRNCAAAAAEGARPTTVPPVLVQAWARACMAVVLPVPAGAIASCTRAPEVAIARTSPAWPASSWTPFAVISNNATSTAVSGMVRPPVRPAAATRRCSAASTDR